MPIPSIASCTCRPMSGSSVAIGSADRVTTVTVEAAVDHRLGHLDADVAAADDDRPARVALASAVEERLAVVEGLHAEHPVGVDAGDLRPARARAGREHQVVEAESVRPARTVVAHLHLAPVQVDGRPPRCASAGRCRWPGAAPECGRPAGRRRRRRRRPSRGCRRRSTTRAAPRSRATTSSPSPAQPLGLRRGRHPGCVAADDHHPLGHAGEATVARSHGVVDVSRCAGRAAPGSGGCRGRSRPAGTGSPRSAASSARRDTSAL